MSESSVPPRLTRLTADKLQTEGGELSTMNEIRTEVISISCDIKKLQ